MLRFTNKEEFLSAAAARGLKVDRVSSVGEPEVLAASNPDGSPGGVFCEGHSAAGEEPTGAIFENVGEFATYMQEWEMDRMIRTMEQAIFGGPITTKAERESLVKELAVGFVD